MKSLIKKIFRRIYEIGFSEYQAKERLKRSKYLDAVSSISHENTFIGEEATIENYQDDSSKITIGKGCSIKGYLLVFKHGGKISVGDHVFIGPQSRIWSASEIKIGNRVLIAHNVNIHDNISHPIDSKLRHNDFVHIKSIGFQESIDLHESPVIIEDDVWIGFNSTILKGVKIGRGAIIGACSLITKDIPPYAVVVGNPPRIIKYTT